MNSCGALLLKTRPTYPTLWTGRSQLARIKMCWSNSINCSGNIGSILPSFDGAIRKSVLGPDGRHGSIIPLLFFERPGRREAAGWHSLGPVTSYGSHSAGIARQKKG